MEIKVLTVLQFIDLINYYVGIYSDISERICNIVLTKKDQYIFLSVISYSLHSCHVHLTLNTFIYDNLKPPNF